MKKNFLLFAFLLMSLVSFAQTGTVRGVMIEDTTGEPVMFGDVTVDETGDYAQSDLDGAFSFDLPVGTYTITMEYVGFANLKISDVVVAEGQVTTIDGRMKEETELIEELVVTATRSRNNEAALATIKRESTSMIDGISSKKFKQTGDSNASDAVKRVTGVSVEGGKYVYVRGLGDRYTKTMLNGIDIPGLDPDRNSLQIDIFPTTLLDNMIVFKSSVAELPADFTGGVVNIETKEFPEERKFDVSFGVSYNPSMHFNSKYLDYEGGKMDWLGYDDGTRALPSLADQKTIPSPTSGDSDQNINTFINSFKNQLSVEEKTALPSYSFGLTYGDQINVGEKNKLGYILSGTYKSDRSFYENNIYGDYQVHKDVDKNELVASTTQVGSVGEENILVGGLAGIAFKTLKSKHKLAVIHLQNGESKAGRFDIENFSDAVGQSGYVAHSNNLEYSQRSITNALLNGNYKLGEEGDLEIDWKLSPTLSKMTEPDIRKAAFSERTGPNDLIIAPGAGGNPSRIWRYLDETSLVGKFDVTKKYQLGGRNSKFKIGASYVNKDRDYKILAYNLQFFGSQPDWASTADNINFDEILVPGNIYPEGKIYYTSLNNNPNPNQYNSNSSNLAFYLSNEFNFNKFQVTAGLRGEKFVQRHTGRDALYASQGTGNNLENKKVLDAFDLFPSLNAKYDLADKQGLRFSYSRTIARPSFKELSYAQIIDPLSNRIFNGGLFPYQGQWEGNLVETRINNLDLRWELFQERGQLFSVSAFYKGFEKPIELVRIPTAQTTNEFQPRNVGNGTVYGAELEIKKSLGFVSPKLDQLTFSSNITVAQSFIEMTEGEYNTRKAYARNGQTIEKNRKMAGQAPYIVNVGLNYSNIDKGFNAGLFYNLKGKTLSVVGGGLFPDVYADTFHSLNFSSTYNVGEKLKFNFKVSNILGDVRESVFTGYEAQDRPYSSVNLGRTFSLGASYSIL